MHTAMLMNGALGAANTAPTMAIDEESGRARLLLGDGKAGKKEGLLQPPPAAHFAGAKYSPTLNEAASLLLDVRPLSQVSRKVF